MMMMMCLQDDHLAVWHRSAADQAAAGRVRDALRRILQLPAAVPIEYKAHGDCLRASASRADDESDEPEPERS